LTPSASIVCATHRPDPRFSLLADSLARELGDNAAEVAVIVVDGLHSAGRGEQLQTHVAGRFALEHVPAKPTPWNGAYGVTPNGYYATASARNTGIVHAAAPYVVFVDDCSTLLPGWWTAVRSAAAHGQVVTGAVHRQWSPSSNPEPDRRWKLGDENRAVPVGGGNLAAASFGAPRELLVEVNGFDELCDPAGGEDYHLGTRLEWAGASVLYDRRMASVRNGERHRHDVVRRLDRLTDRAAYMNTLRGFGVSQRSFDGPFDSSHLVWDVLFGRRERRSLGNHYELAELSVEELSATAEHLPLVHWFDGHPVGRL
jgi:hypothetical protein